MRCNVAGFCRERPGRRSCVSNVLRWLNLFQHCRIAELWQDDVYVTFSFEDGVLPGGLQHCLCRLVHTDHCDSGHSLFNGLLSPCHAPCSTQVSSLVSSCTSANRNGSDCTASSKCHAQRAMKQTLQTMSASPGSIDAPVMLLVSSLASRHETASSYTGPGSGGSNRRGETVSMPAIPIVKNTEDVVANDEV